MNSSFSDKVIRKINSYSSSELDASTLFSDSEKRRNIYLELNDDYYGKKPEFKKGSQ